MTKKPPGRPKGRQNNASRSLREALEALKFDLPGEFIKLYQDPKLDPATKVKLLQLILDHTYPRLKEVETPVSTPVQTNPASDTTTENLLKLI